MTPSRNGHLSPHELEEVQGSIRLAPPTAHAWRALVDDVRRATGVTIYLSANGGYRSYEDQLRLTGTGHHNYKPGYSVHGWGRCVDINNYASIGSARLDALASAHGFRRTIPSEPWHYEHTPTTPAAVSDLTPIEEDTVKLRFITRHTASPWFVTDGLTKRPLAPGEDRLLVDLGLAVYEEGATKVKVLGDKIDLIPTR